MRLHFEDKVTHKSELFGLLLGASVLGTLALLPFLFTLQGGLPEEIPVPLPVLIGLITLQSAIPLAIAIFAGLALGKRVGLGAPILENWVEGRPVLERFKPIVLVSIVLGGLAGLLIIGLDFVFSLFIEPISFVAPPIWQGLLASLYGGITEEVLTRLFLMTLLMTLLVWVFSRVWKTTEHQPTRYVYWLAIIAAAVLFGVGHLPATAALTTLTSGIITRTILLNSVGAVIFGWLYWKRGLESAMIAHFSADLVLHVLYPLFFSSLRYHLSFQREPERSNRE